MSPPPDIAVVVPTFRRPDGLARLITALGRQTLPFERWELVVVDDGSPAGDAAAIDEVVARAPVPARVIHADRNQGPAAARNAGWNATSAPYIAFTDDDCEPQPGWLAAGLAALEADGRVGIVQGKTVRAQDGADYPYTCFTVVREVLQPTPWFEGCNLFFRREALKDGGGFDEHLGYFGEETSLAWQAIEAGWERAWADDAVVEHELADRPWRWHMRIHYLERNTAWLVARHPQMRAMFWRPWAVKREGALFALAALGLAIGVRYRVGLLLTLPYLRWLPPPWRKEIGWQGVGHLVSIHAASFVGKVAGSARERTLLL